MAQFKFQEWLESDDTDAQSVSHNPAPGVSAPVRGNEDGVAFRTPIAAQTHIEQARYRARLSQFIASGIDYETAQIVAEDLIKRDRDMDDRRSCAECRHQSYKHCRRGLFSVGGFDIELLHRCRGYKDD